jgi:uncharacterized membrane protein
MGSNLLFCLTLTSVPFLTKLLGYFPDSKVAVAFYSLGILAMTVGKEILWQVIARQNFSSAHAKRRIKNAPAMCVGVATTGLAMFYPKMAVAMWALFGAYAVFIRLKTSRAHVSECENGEVDQSK